MVYIGASEHIFIRNRDNTETYSAINSAKLAFIHMKGAYLNYFLSTFFS